jgi:peptidylprolyl isomerase
MTPTRRSTVTRRLPFRAAALIVAGALLSAGCASSGNEAANNTSLTTDLAAVKVTGEDGKKPIVDVPAPFSVSKTDRKVLKTGQGALIANGQRVSINYVGVNGTDGKEFDTSFGKEEKASFTMDANLFMKGLVSGLQGTKVGSRVLIAVPPKDAYGAQGVPSAGIGPTDTLVFVVDVTSAANVLKRATGTAVKPKAGLPTVKLDRDGKPKITLPAGAPPAKLSSQLLIQGKGAKVTKGQSITVHYTGIVWPGGKQFDSSWDRKAPATFYIGVGRVITGWDETIVGQTVGSQLLLVIPPDKGYGASGNPSAGIKGTDTLVFVIDILDATS